MTKIVDPREKGKFNLKSGGNSSHNNNSIRINILQLSDYQMIIKIKAHVVVALFCYLRYVSIHWNVLRHKWEMKVVHACLKYLHVVVVLKCKIVLHLLKYVP